MEPETNLTEHPPTFAQRVNKVMESDWLDRWITPVVANLLWAGLSLVVITIPIALVGLFSVVYRWLDGQKPSLFVVFFNTIRYAWRKAYALAAIDLVIGGIAYLNLLIFTRVGADVPQLIVLVSGGMTMIIALLLLMVNLYTWTLIAIWDVTFRQILSASVKLIFLHPFRSLLMAATALLVIFLATTLPLIFLVFFGGAIIAGIAARATARLLHNYIPPQEFEWLIVE